MIASPCTGVTLIVLEAIVLGLAVADPPSAVQTLARLGELRAELIPLR